MDAQQITGCLVFQKDQTYYNVPMDIVKKIGHYKIIPVTMGVDPGSPAGDKSIGIQVMTVKQLTELCAEQNIDITGLKTKKEILNAIESAKKE